MINRMTNDKNLAHPPHYLTIALTGPRRLTLISVLAGFAAPVQLVTVLSIRRNVITRREPQVQYQRRLAIRQFCIPDQFQPSRNIPDRGAVRRQGQLVGAGHRQILLTVREDDVQLKGPDDLRFVDVQHSFV